MNLAPADLRKAGASLDLAIAVGILLGSEQVRATGRWAFIGELSLGGERPGGPRHPADGRRARPARGAPGRGPGRRGASRRASPTGSRRTRRPGWPRSSSCSASTGVAAATAGRRAGAGRAAPPISRSDRARPSGAERGGDRPAASRTWPTSAARRSAGAPSRSPWPAATGCSCRSSRGPARRSSPGRSRACCRRSTTGRRGSPRRSPRRPATGPLDRLVRSRPFRAPHHTISYAGMLGGGPRLSPGEVTRADEGVLFLDELPEFGRDVLEALRQPLEDGRVSIVRVGRLADPAGPLPARRRDEPVPVRRWPAPAPACRCSPGVPERYAARVSGPLRDRIDLWVEMPPVPQAELVGRAGPSRAPPSRRGSRPPGGSRWPAAGRRQCPARRGAPAGGVPPRGRRRGPRRVDRRGRRGCRPGASAGSSGSPGRSPISTDRTASDTTISRRRPASGSRAARTPASWRSESVPTEREAWAILAARPRPRSDDVRAAPARARHGGGASSSWRRPPPGGAGSATDRDGTGSGCRRRWSSAIGEAAREPEAILARLARCGRDVRDGPRRRLPEPASPDRGAAAGALRPRCRSPRSTGSTRSPSSGRAGRPRPVAGSPPGSPTRWSSVGAVVVSGLAVGIDGAAHAAAVAAGGPTVAVLGSGHGRLYPRAHGRLAAAIVDDGRRDRLASWPPMPDRRSGTFPRRNRLISGLADATVVVEAAPRQRRADHRPLGARAGPRLLRRAGLDRRAGSAGCLAFLRAYPGEVRVVTGIAELLDDLGARRPATARSGPRTEAGLARRGPRPARPIGARGRRGARRTARRASTSSPSGPGWPCRRSSGRSPCSRSGGWSSAAYGRYRAGRRARRRLRPGLP